MKTYVISDVHGLWPKFSDFVDTLEPDDLVYVLGDVIDRGPEGIQILQYIKDHPEQFKMVIGNHEDMMLRYIEATKGVDLEKASYFQIKEISRLYDWWVIRNQGEPTLADYERLSDSKQEKVHQFIKNLPVAYTNVKVGENTFYLVHSTADRLEKEVVLQSDLEEPDEIKRYIWTRPTNIEDYYVDGKIVVSGHTMTIKHHGKLEIYISKDEDANIRYIDIDCGCAMNRKESKLAALCLDDLSVQYF